MAKQVLDNIQLQNNLDWFHFESAIRKEVHNLLVPFRDELSNQKDLARSKYDYMDKLFDRLNQVEIFAMIELAEGSNPDHLKKNKFDILEERIFDN